MVEIVFLKGMCWFYSRSSFPGLQTVFPLVCDSGSAVPRAVPLSRCAYGTAEQLQGHLLVPKIRLNPRLSF